MVITQSVMMFLAFILGALDFEYCPSPGISSF